VLDPTTLNEILQTILTANDEDMYGEVLEVLLRLTKSRYGVFGYIEENGALVIPSLTRDIWEKCQMTDKTIYFPKETWGKSIWGRAITEKRGLRDNYIKDLPQGHVEIKNVLAVPIIFRGETIGLFEVANRKEGYGDHELDMLESIAEVIAPVMFARMERDQSEKRYRTLLNSTSDIIVSFDKEFRHTGVNQSASLRLGLESHEFTGKSLRDLGFPEDAVQQWEGLFRQVIATKSLVSSEITLPLPDGVIETYEYTVTPVFEKGGAVSGVRVIARQITELKEAQKRVKENEEYFRRTVELMPVALLNYNKEGILFANTTAANLLGASAEELFGKHFFEFLLPEYREVFIEKLNTLEKESDSSVRLTAKIITLTEKVVDTELIIIPSIYRGERAAQIIALDMTRRKKIEQEIMKADKLESLSLLTGGIAHDFNNIMAIVLGNISLSLKEIKEEDKTYKRLKSAEQAVQQAKELTKQLHTFAKGGDPIKNTVSTGDLIRDTTQFILCGTNVRCIYSFPNDLYFVNVDVGQISQVINNLTINAIHAMPDGGFIQIKAENVVIEELEDVPELILSKGRYVKVIIQDSGIGIEKKNLKKIFDPYFSTKVEGSGLGLATSYSIVKRHGGFIKVESEPGVGTTFFIYLPASLDKTLEEEKKSKTIIKGRGRILVMDDEEGIRNVLGEMLTFLGYQVDFASHGEEAIEIYKKMMELNNPYDIVILDLTIPGGMGGKQAMSILNNLYPGINAIITTGYSEDLAEVNCNDFGFKGFIKKPYDLEQLSETLDRAFN